jgi:hypothetical protein
LDEDIKMKFHSHLLDNKTHIAASAHVQMDVLLTYLQKEKVLNGMMGTIFDHTDGCTKQYCSATETYLLSMMATKSMQQ